MSDDGSCTVSNSYTDLRNGVTALKPVRVAIIYHIWPHYRRAVMQALDRSAAVEYHFFGSGESYLGIEHVDPETVAHFVRAPVWDLGSMFWQPAAVRTAFSKRYDAVIYLGDAHYVSTWFAAAIGRVRRVPVLFWTHGWLRKRRGAVSYIRNLFFRLADHLLIYGERGKRLGAGAHFPSDRMSVVYNSLDVALADSLIADIEREKGVRRPQDLFAEPARPLLICSARLTPLCRFDLLLEAAALLKQRGRPVNILLIGDGPERGALEARAARLGVEAHFFGACYDEAVVGRLLYHADITVSPGKIGLTAMHSLMYGTPAITHGNLDEQMPEVEAIEGGVTGAFFNQGDAASLADAIEAWLSARRDRRSVRAACLRVVHDKWNADSQARIIDEAILAVVDGKRRSAEYV